ncbi:MAG TPA: hypothetical protein V6D19_17680 [Stenomitos sp.]
MDQSINIPWTSGMNYGMGVNLLTGDIAGKAINPGEITGPTKAEGQTVSYNLILINSMEELYSSLGMSIEASGHYGLFKASGKAQYAKESKFNSQATFLLARCVVQNAFMQAEEAQIKPEAIDLIVKNEKKFQDRYGDGFVRGMQTGGEFFVVISITSQSKVAQTTFAAALQAQYGGKVAGGKVTTDGQGETALDMANIEIRISTYQRGGVGCQQSLAKDVESVMTRLADFPAQVQQNPIPYEVQVASYHTLALPEGPNPIDVEQQKNALESYARLHLKYLSLQNDVEFVQLNPHFYKEENMPKMDVLNRWNDFFTEKSNKLRQQASACANNTNLNELQQQASSDIKGSCPILPLELPEDFEGIYKLIRTTDELTLLMNKNMEDKLNKLITDLEDLNNNVIQNGQKIAIESEGNRFLQQLRFGDGYSKIDDTAKWSSNLGSWETLTIRKQ